jgi:Flp pilus assembly protein TadG
MMRSGSSAILLAGRPSGSPLTRLWSACNGAAAIETAFVLPMFFLFLFGIVECGRAFWIQSSLQYAVTSAARCAAVNPSKCSDVPSYAAAQAYGMSIPSTDFTYTSGTTCGNVGYSTGSKVAVSYTFTTGLPHLIPKLSSVKLSATACHP